ncbi:tripartite tricarboxylate transporter substrate binding protein [Pseudooceanicola sp. 216_PA32_1]|uniref:Tripartite tricarboxylate transporter substrate binding protein n=1 Tax=Pseudooceanicola pacificus TaxID=2676438 RepID=A0A844WCG4_9RHOB|nr:tripartite tricarboxylate transporter substrate binding protein [Pseudooceanicola pacificus]MWB78688.1 tripartite tricarboxylate transporter substrate binding protein [Pseudooceanicola pacificus]
MKRLITAVSTALVVTAGAAMAEWPDDKPITLIHPFAAGSDYLARLVGAALEERLGQTVIIENRPGAGGAMGTGYAARQRPDGYTLVTSYPGPAANYTNTYKSLPYTPLEDFDYISQMSYGDMVVAARLDFPADTPEELIAYLKAHPGEVSAGNNGIGSYGHMIELAISEEAGVPMRLVPYKGSPPIVTDMLSGSIDLSVDYLGESYIKHLEAGSIKAIAVVSAQRSKILPDVKTFKEVGIDLTAAPWGGIMAPKGTPPQIIERLNKAMTEYLTDPETIATFARIGQTAAPTTPEEFKKIVADEEAQWRPIIKKYGISNE